ncbi:MAG TPA: hypothetical protein VNW04_10630 [Puia sp.]|jgi:hypothetical protein|nr:hypothetical protein [Puia sp.]
MKKKGLYLGRQVLLALIALQILNLSVGSAAIWDNDYDYSYSYNQSYDPTETAVEWIVELNQGQQPAFSYDTHEDTSKSLVKTLHWNTDLQQIFQEPALFPRLRRQRSEIPVQSLLSPIWEIVSPPPEAAAA